MSVDDLERQPLAMECGACGKWFRMEPDGSTLCRLCEKRGVTAKKVLPAAEPDEEEKDYPEPSRPSTIRLTCPICSTSDEVPDNKVGAEMQCRECDARFTVSFTPSKNAPTSPKSKRVGRAEKKLEKPSVGVKPSSTFICSNCRFHGSVPKDVKDKFRCPKCEQIILTPKRRPSSRSNFEKAVRILAIILGSYLSIILSYALISDIVANRPNLIYNPQTKSKLTKENFLSVKVGMTGGDVKLILGTPDNVISDTLGSIYEYKEGFIEVGIIFNAHGLVINKTQRGIH
jgi:hypothetical protein